MRLQYRQKHWRSHVQKSKERYDHDHPMRQKVPWYLETEHQCMHRIDDNSNFDQEGSGKRCSQLYCCRSLIWSQKSRWKQETYKYIPMQSTKWSLAEATMHYSGNQLLFLHWDIFKSTGRLVGNRQTDQHIEGWRSSTGVVNEDRHALILKWILGYYSKGVTLLTKRNQQIFKTWPW